MLKRTSTRHNMITTENGEKLDILHLICSYLDKTPQNLSEEDILTYLKGVALFNKAPHNYPPPEGALRAHSALSNQTVIIAINSHTTFSTKDLAQALTSMSKHNHTMHPSPKCLNKFINSPPDEPRHAGIGHKKKLTIEDKLPQAIQSFIDTL